MKGILDTPLVIELLKPQIKEKINDFFSEHYTSQFFLSVITLAEISRQIKLLPGSNKKKALEVWLMELIQEFPSEILPIDLETAIYYETNFSNKKETEGSIHASFFWNVALAFSKRLPLITFSSTPLPSFANIQIINLNEDT